MELRITLWKMREYTNIYAAKLDMYIYKRIWSSLEDHQTRVQVI